MMPASLRALKVDGENKQEESNSNGGIEPQRSQRSQRVCVAAIRARPIIQVFLDVASRRWSQHAPFVTFVTFVVQNSR
jgi:hypothetical protein